MTAPRRLSPSALSWIPELHFLQCHFPSYQNSTDTASWSEFWSDHRAVSHALQLHHPPLPDKYSLSHLPLSFSADWIPSSFLLHDKSLYLTRFLRCQTLHPGNRSALHPEQVKYRFLPVHYNLPMESHTSLASHLHHIHFLNPYQTWVDCHISWRSAAHTGIFVHE